jgi:chitinase
MRANPKLWLLAATAVVVSGCGGDPEGSAAAQGDAAQDLGFATAALTGPSVIYADALASGWSDASRVAHDLANQSPVAAGTRSISVTFRPRSALYLRGTGVATAGLAYLDLHVNGGANAAPAISAFVTVSGAARRSVSIAPYCAGGIRANAWTRCLLPLSALGAAGARIDGVTLAERAGRTLSTMYFDEIQLTAATVSIPAAPGGLTSTAGTASVSLAWNAVADATGYNVYRAASQAGPYEKLTASPVTTTSYLDASVASDATYWYTAAAVNAAGEGARSTAVSATVPATNPDPGPTCSAGADACAFLSAHNSTRTAATPTPSPALPSMSWSDGAAAAADAWARQCTWAHDPKLRTLGYGQNLFASTSAPTPAAVVTNWASEAANYDYASNTCAAGKVCGHYTQVVWRTSVGLGCSMVRCNTGSPFGSFNGGVWWNVACDYAPPGNWIGQRPY